MSFVNKTKAKAYDSIMDNLDKLLVGYKKESQDWDKERLRYLLDNLVEYLEGVEYIVDATTFRY